MLSLGAQARAAITRRCSQLIQIAGETTIPCQWTSIGLQQHLSHSRTQKFLVLPESAEDGHEGSYHSWKAGAKRMRLFRRLILGVVPAVSLLLLVDLIPSSPAEAAGPDPSLCSFTSSRLNLPSGFPLNVCWDGSRVVIKNTTPFVMQISLSGNVGSLSRTSVDGDAAGAVIAATDTNPAVLPPEYQLTVPVGSSGASFAVQGNSENVTYAKLRALEGFVPGNLFADYEAISGFVGELSDDSSHYAQCKAGANFIEAAACSASFAWNVNFAVDRLAVQTDVNCSPTHSASEHSLI